MRRDRIFSISVFVMFLASSVYGMAQGQSSVPAPEGWGQCPRCQNNKDRTELKEKYKVEGHPFSPHDLSGVWGFGGVAGAFRNPPPLTEWGKQQHTATVGDKNAAGEYLHNKDTSEGEWLANSLRSQGVAATAPDQLRIRVHYASRPRIPVL
jgi:hypothetical protein